MLLSQSLVESTQSELPEPSSSLLISTEMNTKSRLWQQLLTTKVISMYFMRHSEEEISLESLETPVDPSPVSSQSDQPRSNCSPIASTCSQTSANWQSTDSKRKPDIDIDTST